MDSLSFPIRFRRQQLCSGQQGLPLVGTDAIHNGQEQELHILYGEAEFSAFRIPAESAARNGTALAGKRKDGEWIPAEPVRLRAGDRLTFSGTAVRV